MLLVGSDLEATGGRDADLAYMRVADDIAARIASRELAPGARLRSERDLAEYYEVSYGTIRRATAVLRDRGLIETIHGRGTFVKKRLELKYRVTAARSRAQPRPAAQLALARGWAGLSDAGARQRFPGS